MQGMLQQNSKQALTLNFGVPPQKKYPLWSCAKIIIYFFFKKQTYYCEVTFSNLKYMKQSARLSHVHLSNLLWLAVSKQPANADCILNKKFWEELITYFPLMQHEPHRKQCVQQFFCCMFIHCHGNMFIKQLASNNGEGEVDTHTHRERWSLKPTSFFPK
jgi:hypothetical protein